MKIIAAAVVSLVRKLPPPLAPKTDWLPPPPNEAPISAPLPDWRRTTPMMNRQVNTCSTDIKVVINRILYEDLKLNFIA